MPIKHALAAVAASVGLALGGCGDDADTDSSNQPEFNAADITFAQEMIPHHQQAVMMATIAVDRAKDPAVATLATEIQDAQGPEIETLQAWLRDWDAEVSHEMGEMGHNMPGMMSEHELARLSSASGQAFDRTFLRLMIEHHDGAIETAQAEQAEGANPDAIALAKDIAAAQSDEIEDMQSILNP